MMARKVWLSVLMTGKWGVKVVKFWLKLMITDMYCISKLKYIVKHGVGNFKDEHVLKGTKN